MVIADELDAPPGGTPWRAGDRVYLRPAVSCGACFYCGRGLPNLCAELIGVGSHTPGFFADEVSVPRAALAAVPPGLSHDAGGDDRAAGHRGARRCAVPAPPMRTVVVIGGGSIGQCMLLAALTAGAAAVVVCEPQNVKRQLALDLGAVAALDPAEPETGKRIRRLLDGRPDAVFDCVASAVTLRDSVQLASRGGTVVVVGVGHGPVEVAIESIQDDQVALIGSAMYVPDDFRRAEEMIAAGAPVERLVTATRPLAEGVDALAQAAGGQQVKIHLAGEIHEQEQR